MQADDIFPPRRPKGVRPLELRRVKDADIPHLLPVTGWNSDCLDGHIPAVVVYEGADTQDLLAWAHGQIRQLEVLLEVICLSEGAPDRDPTDLAAAVLHFIGQADAVLAAAEAKEERKDEERRKAEAARNSGRSTD